jgi:hypothetical protein
LVLREPLLLTVQVREDRDISGEKDMSDLRQEPEATAGLPARRAEDIGQLRGDFERIRRALAHEVAAQQIDIASLGREIAAAQRALADDRAGTELLRAE